MKTLIEKMRFVIITLHVLANDAKKKIINKNKNINTI